MYAGHDGPFMLRRAPPRSPSSYERIMWVTLRVKIAAAVDGRTYAFKFGTGDKDRDWIPLGRLNCKLLNAMSACRQRMPADSTRAHDAPGY